ncbi:MAG: TRAP transporter TatT component family protein, partial [Polyangiales bacterium]
GKMLLAVVAAQQFPPEMEQSKALFDEVLAHNERRLLIAQVSMARYYAVAIGDYALFKQLLEEVVAAGDVLPEARMLNVIARRRAQRYLRQAHLFFSELEG